MSPQTAPVTLADLQRALRPRLERVQQELRRIVEADFGLITEVNSHLFQMQGKMFRPTLLLLAEEATGGHDPRATALAAVVELIHLATLVHDDSVDHSVLRRGMPTINSLFSHQVSVIMGDYLYSRAVIELVRLDDLEPLRVLSRVTNEMTVGEMRQLLAHDPLEFSEEQYDLLIRAKTASLVSGACEIGALRAGRRSAAALRRFGEALGMAFQIVDDLLDYTEDATVTGKPFGSDLREHKVPCHSSLRFPNGTAQNVARSRGCCRRRSRAIRQIAEVIEAVGPAGGLAYARERALRLAQLAEGELDLLPPSPRGKHCGRASPTSSIAGADAERPRRPGFYLGVLVAGFVVGGFLTSLFRQTGCPTAPPGRSSPAPGHADLRPCLGRSAGDILHPRAGRAPRLPFEPDRGPAWRT